MLNSKTKLTALLLTSVAFSSANAQFYDLDEQGLAMPSGNYKSSLEEPVINETSGDENGFIAEQNPDFEAYNPPVFNALPVANGFDSFADNVLEEESVKEQLRDIKQLDYLGFLDAKFDEALWVGIDYNYAKARFAKFKDIKSIHIRKIARDMLMAKARVPQTKESWLALRLKTLIEMGNISDAKLLLKDVKPKELLMLENKELNSLYLQTNLLENTTYEFIKSLLEQDSSSINYKKAFLVSLYNQGNADQAKLSFNALIEANEDVKNSDFSKIFAASLNSQELDIADFAELDVYNQYLVALNPGLFKGNKFKQFKDYALLIAAENADSIADKTMYLEILMQNYPFSYNSEYLTAAYKEHQFSTKDLSVPLKYIQESNNQYTNRALLYQSSKIKGLNSTKALSLKKLWESYAANNLGNLKLIITEKTQDIAVNSTIAWFSLDLLKNELKQAHIDYRTLNTLYENIDNAYMSSNALNLQIAVEFLRKTSLVGANFDSIQDYKETLQTWFDAQEIKTSADYNYVLKVLTLLDALEAPITDNMWAKLYEYSNSATNEKTNPIWLRLITNAMQKDEKGKALLLVTEKFVNDDEQSLNAQTLANIIATLNYLNMPQEMALVGVNAIVK